LTITQTDEGCGPCGGERRRKVLTPRELTAVRAIIEASVRFTITSGRPSPGMKALIDEVPLQDLITALNGGLFVRTDLSVTLCK
jgi:hydroxymethylpyrimidine pyrophosphatase-like HAD family hydrolase